MKKILAILLTLIFTFSCFSVLGTSTAFAEQSAGQELVKSDFEKDYESGSTHWVSTIAGKESVEIKKEENEDVYYARVSNIKTAEVGMFTTPFELYTGNEYELSFEFRTPKTRDNGYNLGGTAYQPAFGLFEVEANSDKSEVVSGNKFVPVDTFYAYHTSNIKRRTGFSGNWTITTGEETSRTVTVYDNPSSYIRYNTDGYNDLISAKDATEVYKNWAKVTFKFNAVAKEEGELSQTAAFAFFYNIANNSDLVFDIKNVKLICTKGSDGTVIPEEPEVNPNAPGELKAPVTVLNTDGEAHPYAADLGVIDAKGTKNSNGTYTFTINYDAMEGVNSFEGWFDGETLLSTEETYTSTADVNAEDVKAKIICRSVISGGLGFESHTEKTSLAVQPEKQGTLLYEDKWGLWSIYGKNGHYETDTNTFTRYAYYMSDSARESVYNAETGTFNRDKSVTIRPYSGNSMFGFDARGRSIVRKLDNLKPNTEYQLSFYSYNLSKWDFLERVTVANTYDLLTKTIASSETSYTVDNVKVYGYYKEDLAETDIRYNTPKIADENKVQKWTKITVNFKTDNNTEFYLHLATSNNGYDALTSTKHYIDNLTVCEVEIPDSFEKSVEYKGAAIRRGDDKTPQALRVKFEIPNSITNLYNDNGYSLKEYGALVAYDQNLNGTELNFDTSAKYFKGVAYNEEDGTNKVFATTATGSVVSFALYNIGVTNGTTDYSAYNKEFVVRPYSIYIDESGNEYIYYANSESISLFDVVDAILDQSTLESVKPSGLTGYLSDVITARNILSGEAYDAYKAAGRNIYSQNDSMGGLTLNDLGENLPIHTELQAEYLTGEYADIANFASGVAELSRPMPITFSWNDTNSTGTLYRYLLTVSENSDLSNPLVYATADNSIDIYNFKIGTDYYWNVTAIYSDGIVVSDVDKFSTEATGPRNLYISGTTNARDLGGWTINGKQTNQGVIFRSSQIDYITVEGRNTLINELGVKTEIDIRESKEAVNTLPDDLNYNAFHTKSHIFKDSKETIKKFFGVLGNKANYPIIFHCKIGTDRTGMMGFLLNALLGASEEQLYTDYLYSNFGYIAGARDREVIDGYLEVINAAEGETFAEKTYNYLVNLGVNSEHMDTFIEMMTK